MANKPEIRAHIRHWRSGLTDDEVQSRSRAACARLRELPLYRTAQRVACYMARPKEVQTASLVADSVAAGKRVALPQHNEDGSGYHWCWMQPDESWRTGPWHIAEPALAHPATARELDLAIVPAVAVDRQGVRLGHGGGHFDRLLADLRCPIVATIFDYQLFDQVPRLAHDVSVDWIVTETETYSVRAHWRTAETAIERENT